LAIHLVSRQSWVGWFSQLIHGLDAWDGVELLRLLAKFGLEEIVEGLSWQFTWSQGKAGLACFHSFFHGLDAWDGVELVN
jgi:hypothetical protein